MAIRNCTRPALAPVPAGVCRPFISVMIPVYNRGCYLEQAIRSVLVQDPGPNEMQIEVVDDHSADVNIEAIARGVGQGRVGFFRQPSNLGMVANWNMCLERARGQWIHVLHDDDWIMPGFYAALRPAAAAEPALGAWFCHWTGIGAQGEQTSRPELVKPAAGVLPDFAEIIFDSCVIRCPGIVVKRDTYERLGCYTPDLAFAADWEMWVHIAVHGCPVWYEPEQLAVYREYTGASTSQFMRGGADIADIARAIEFFASYLSPAQAQTYLVKQQEMIVRVALGSSQRFLTRGDIFGALAQALAGLRVGKSPAVCQALQAHLLRVVSQYAARVAGWAAQYRQDPSNEAALAELRQAPAAGRALARVAARGDRQFVCRRSWQAARASSASNRETKIRPAKNPSRAPLVIRPSRHRRRRGYPPAPACRHGLPIAARHRHSGSRRCRSHRAPRPPLHGLTGRWAAMIPVPAAAARSTSSVA